jgi:hypothetical protein
MFLVVQKLAVGCGYSILALTWSFLLWLGRGPVLVDQAIEDFVAPQFVSTIT